MATVGLWGQLRGVTDARRVAPPVFPKGVLDF